MLTETLHAGGFIVQESPGFMSRDQATIALSQTLVAGQVLGSTAVITGTTSSASADAGNTASSGAITLDVTTPVLAGAKNGTYRAVCIEPATNGGTFAVFDPAGVEIGKVAVGGTFATEIKFVIADATDFVAGDAFSIVVGIEKSDKNYKAFDPTATDGAQRPSAILFAAITTDGSTKKQATILARNCEVRAADLTWPDAISAADKAAGIAVLELLGIVCR